MVGGLLAEPPGPSHLRFDVLVSFATLGASDRRADLADWNNSWNFATYLLLDRPETAERAWPRSLPALTRGTALRSTRTVRLDLSDPAAPGHRARAGGGQRDLQLQHSGRDGGAAGGARARGDADGRVQLRQPVHGALDPAGRRDRDAQGAGGGARADRGPVPDRGGARRTRRARRRLRRCCVWLVPAFNGLAPVQMLGAQIDAGHLLDPRLLGLFVVFSIGVGLVAGLYPAHGARALLAAGGPAATPRRHGASRGDASATGSSGRSSPSRCSSS